MSWNGLIDLEKYGCTLYFMYYMQTGFRDFATRDEFYDSVRRWEEWDCITKAGILNLLEVAGGTSIDGVIFIRKSNGQGAKTKHDPWNYPLDAKFKFCVQLYLQFWPREQNPESWQRDLSYQECRELGFNVHNGRSAVHPFLHANADPAYMRLKEAHDKTIKEFRKFTEGYSNERWPWRGAAIELNLPVQKPRVDYDERMKRDDWQQIRNQVFQRDKHKCRHCGSGKSIVCHHITYDTLGREPLDDLLTLCKRCHYKVHEEDLRRKGQRV